MKVRKELITIIMAFVFLVSLVSAVRASSVALVVEDAESLSEEHEKRVYTTLTNMGHEVSLVDVGVNYFDYDLIVVAFTSSADIPVNDVPTIAIYHHYLEDWGWVEPGGLGSLTRSDRHNVIIQKDHPLTKGYSVGEKVYVHLIYRTRVIDMRSTHTNLDFVATVSTRGGLGLIAYAASNTELHNDKTVSDDSAIVFFGIPSPLYWTDEAIDLFKNSVDWLTNDTDEDGLKDYMDNCFDTPNLDQADTDSDGLGDVCDPDKDNDDTLNEDDNCPSTSNPDQTDKDRDGMGDECDDDEDGDDLKNDVDNCPSIYNPDQLDTDDDGVGDDCNPLPYQIFLDVDNDGENETAINENNITEDGFEIYEDSNSNAIPLDGDFDGMIDWLIDIRKNGRYDKYWDPDDEILTNVTRISYDYYIDIDGDIETDIIYNSRKKAFILRFDVDSDSKQEEALDRDLDGSYDEYDDPDKYSKLLDIIDGDEDGKNDFIICIEVCRVMIPPPKYWDPDDDILTDITMADADNDGNIEYLIDVDNDGEIEKIFNEEETYDPSDLIVEKLVLNPSSPSPGQDVDITATIKNEGGYDANDFIVEFKIDDDVQRNKTISLAGNSSTDLEFHWRDVSAGSYTIEIIADSTNVILESNEDNNGESMGVSISASAPPTDDSSDRGSSKFVSRGTANFIGFPDKVEVYLGENITVSGKFSSTLNYNLTNVTFRLKAVGFDLEWFTITPESYDTIKQDDSVDIEIEFNIPPDAEIYTYPITIKAFADSILGKKSFSHDFKLMFKERVEEPISPTTTTTTTTTIPEEEPVPSPLTGLFPFVESYPWLIVIIVIIIALVVWKVVGIRFTSEKEYVYGQGWKFLDG